MKKNYTNTEIEQNVSTAVEHATPDVLDQILSSAAHETEADVVELFPESTGRRSRFSTLQRGLATAAALLFVCAAGLGISRLQTTPPVASDPATEIAESSTVVTEPVLVAAASIVMLDVNPSFRMEVAADETVTDVIALNDDAKSVLGSMELKNVSLEVALNALVGSMFQNGYLSDLQNSILVSVENPDAQAGEALRSKITAAINTLASDTTQLAVLSQTMDDADDILEDLAEQYRISEGKAALIQEAIAQDPTLTFEKLSTLSINDIALILSSKQITTTVTQSGTSSTKNYITSEQAVNIAYQDAGVTATNVSQLEVSFDSEDGIMVYEVEFHTTSGEYEYDINARTGDILKVEKPRTTTQAPVTSPQAPVTTPATSSYIGEAAAKAAALKDAGYQESDTKYIHAYIDYDDGIAEHYDIEFVVGNVEYDYEIDLYQGTILDKSVENHDDDDDHHQASAPAVNPTPTPVAATITEATAKSTALNHAGAAESAITEFKIKLDNDDPTPMYEIEFKYNGAEYDYEINALTGAIAEYDMDIDD